MPSYSCPECRAKVKTEAEAKPGQKLRCTSCEKSFIPRAETLAFKDDDGESKKAKPSMAKPKVVMTKSAPAKALPAKPASAKPAVAKPAEKPKRADDDDDSGPMTYGMVQESADEAKLAKKNMPKIGQIRDKFAKSARGTAAALLVSPAKLMLAQGALLCLFGIFAFSWLGMWGLIFADVPPSDEEFAEFLFWIFTGIVCMLWGTITCYGAVQAVTLGQYHWAVVGALFGLLPLLAGIFLLLTLFDPRVLAGFAEPETGPIQTDDKEEEKKNAADERQRDEEDEEDEEDEGEEDARPAKRKR